MRPDCLEHEGLTGVPPRRWDRASAVGAAGGCQRPHGLFTATHVLNGVASPCMMLGGGSVGCWSSCRLGPQVKAARTSSSHSRLAQSGRSAGRRPGDTSVQGTIGSEVLEGRSYCLVSVNGGCGWGDQREGGFGRTDYWMVRGLTGRGGRNPMRLVGPVS